MTEIVKPGQALLYMKVGTHAQESLESIIKRKTEEIEKAGFALWGYGGGTCHPETMVQPFARSYELKGGIIYLCMEEMNSRHFADQIRADEYSINGIDWIEIPEAIRVLGSRYALAIQKLHKEEFDLPLSRARVAVGNSTGARGDRYISGRVDKACFEVTAEEADPEARIVRIGLVAEVVKPYAVYVRNRPL